MPSFDQVGTPAGFDGFFHFSSSVTPGMAPRTASRTWRRTSPRQSVAVASLSSNSLIFVLISGQVQLPRLDLVGHAPVHQRVLAAMSNPDLARRNLADGPGQ